MGEFYADKGWADTSSKESWINEFYKERLLSIEDNNDIEKQKQGIDKVLKTEGVWVEEKIRREDYGDILLEEYSNWKQQTPGWMMDKTKRTEVLSYIVEPSQKIWLFDFKRLQELWDNNYLYWLDKYERRFAKTYDNDGNLLYRTSNIPVPEGELVEALIAKNF